MISCRIGLFVLWFVAALVPTYGLSLDLDDSSDSSEDALFADFADELGVDLKDGFSFILVDHTNSTVSIENNLYWRSIPSASAANTFPAEYRIAGRIAIGPSEKLLEGDRGVVKVWEPKGNAEVPRGTFSLKPGDISFTSGNGSVSSTHPAVKIEGSEVRILCAPVVFQGQTPDGVPVPVPVQLFDGKDALLRDNGPFSLLTVWLPIAAEYRSSFGQFRVEQDGRVSLISPKSGVKWIEDRLVQVVDPDKATPALALDPKKLYLSTHRGRSVFTQEEKAHIFTLIPRGFSGGPAEIKVNGEVLSKLDLPAAGDRNWDSRGWTLDLSAFSPGPLEVTVDAGAAGQSAPLELEVVRWERKSPFLIHTMSCCTEEWPTTDEGLQLLSEAGLEMLTSTSHSSSLNTAMPFILEDYDRSLPPELSLQHVNNDVLLERFTKHRLRNVDLTVARGANFYMEGLSYHHSYKPSVDRMIRRMSIFTQQTADYPSFWGVNYSWFTKPGGYVEGGIPTDYHTGKRNQAVDQKIAELGFENKPWRERLADKKWAVENAWSEIPADREKALKMIREVYERWKLYNKLTLGDHNALYNEAVRTVRPETKTLLFDNVGHDPANRARDQFNDMEAVAYESYTDYGEWPMSAPFGTDYAQSHSPDQPVWITIDWGTSSEGAVKSLYHAFARGLDGGGIPMQRDKPMQELERRGKMLKQLQMYGSIARSMEPENRVAILSTPTMRMVTHHQYYYYHSVYYSLTRLGIPPILVDAEQAMENGISQDIEALFIVEQTIPLFPETRKAVEDYVAGGGKVFFIGDTKISIDGATRIEGDLKYIWDIGGFFPQAHAGHWKEFTEKWKEPLSQAMQSIGIEPFASTDPLKGLAIATDVGPIRYVVVASDFEGTHAREFNAIEDLPVSLLGKREYVRDLARQTDLTTSFEAGRTLVTVDLVSEPATLLAVYDAAPDRVNVVFEGSAYSASVYDTAGENMGAVPLCYTLTDPDGSEYDTLYRAAGDRLDLPIPVRAPSGIWTLTVQELLTGRSVRKEIQHNQDPSVDIVAAVPDVDVVNPHQMKEYARAEGERVILLDTNQRHLRPLADQLADRLREAGFSTRVWQLSPEEMDSIPTRWIPREEDLARIEKVEAGELIGYRKNLKPYIDDDLARHIPDRGGYATIDPPWMIGEHVILFSGSRFAESLKKVETWLETPSIPGSGQARLVMSFNSFYANRYAAVIAAHDEVGRQAGADKLVKEMVRYASSTSPDPVLETPPPTTDADVRVVESADLPVPTPLVGFRPFLRVRKVMSFGDGRLAVLLRGDGNNLVTVGPDGTVQGAFRLEAADATVDTQGHIWAYTGTRWKALRAVGYQADGTPIEVIDIELGKTTGNIPEDGPYVNNLRIGPHGKWIVAARYGGLYIGNLETRQWRFYDDLPHVKWRLEIWNPRLPIGMTFSLDGSKLFFTMDSRPTGSNNMSGYSFFPTANEMVLLDIETLERIWALREPPSKETFERLAATGAALDSKKFVTHSGFAAVADGGNKTALADYIGYVHVVDASGKPALSQEVIPTSIPPRAKAGIGPIKGVGTWTSPDGNLSVFAFDDRLVIATGDGQAVTVDQPDVHSARVTEDGQQVVAALTDGDVIAYDASGKELWRFDSLGSKPELATVPDGGIRVANHHGVLFALDGKGNTLWQTDVQAAANQAPLKAVAVTDDIPRFPPQPLYHEPNTLEVAKKHLSAKKVTEWTPATAEGESRYGYTFYPVASDLELSAGSEGPCFVRMVYRRPDENKALSVVTRQPNGEVIYDLDLNTPEYRVVYLPMFGNDKTIEIKTEGPFEVADLSIWSFQWPGPNVALIQSGDLGSGMEIMSSKNDSMDRLEGLDDIMDLDQDGSTLVGQFKEVNVYYWNDDPDKTKGDYLNPGIQPMLVVDGERFIQNPAHYYWSRQDIIGSWFTMQFPYPIPMDVISAYSLETKQSEVQGHLAAFQNFNKKGKRDAGPVIAGVIDSDQFWTLLPAGDEPVENLGVHVYQFTRSHGLSEIEVYIKKP